MRRQVATAFVCGCSLAFAFGCERDPSPAASSREAGGERDAAEAPLAVDAPRLTATATSATGSFTARWSMPDPVPVGDPFAVEIELFADPGLTQPLDGGSCRIDAAMPHHGHGMNVAPRMRREGPGRWRAIGMLLHMPGRWEVFVDLERDGFLERAQSTVVLP
jgi:hypothetical protein